MQPFAPLLDRIRIRTADCVSLLKTVPDESVQLVVTSPPYNIGKSYEQRLTIVQYNDWMRNVLAHCARVLKPGGSLCWEVGTHMLAPSRPLNLAFLFARLIDEAGDNSLIYRNAIIWHFEHGLHSSRRFSGRYETILWYSKGEDYKFNLDAVRVPQKYPGKRHYKGPKKGQPSGNPLGKNPGDVWTDMPNVKANHVEKTEHPCQYPVGLAKRLILAFSDHDDLVMDPFLGSGTTAIAAYQTGRRFVGCDLNRGYTAIARRRLLAAHRNELRTRDNGPSADIPVSHAVRRPPPGFVAGDAPATAL